MNHLLESQAEVCRAIINDFKFNDKPRVLRELVDETGLYVTVFSEKALRDFYEASVRAYTKAAPSGEIPRFSDVLLELESSKDPNVDLWKAKYAEKENQKHAYPLAARVLMNSYLGKEVRSIVQDWINSLDKSENVRNDIAGLVSLLVNLTADGHATSKPSDILERAWASGVREPEPTGFDALTRVWDGGWRPKSLVAIGAPSGQGKTSQAISFMCERVRQGRPTLFNSFEQSSEELLFKALCNLSGVLTLDQVENPSKNIRTQDEFDALNWAKAELDRYVRMYDSQCSLQEVQMRVRRHQAEFGPKMDYTIIDHVGAFGNVQVASAASRSYELEAVAKFFKQSISNQYNVCTVMYSQVSDEMEKQLRESNRTNNDGLRNSKGIKHWADVLAVSCRHNGKIKDGKSFMYDTSYNNVSVIQTTKMRRYGLQSLIGLRYDPIHHRLLNEEVRV